jgi:hypothetical protein
MGCSVGWKKGEGLRRMIDIELYCCIVAIETTS